MVVPRYDTQDLVVRYVVRRCIDSVVVYFLFRYLGYDAYERGGWFFILSMLGFMLLLELGDLLSELKRNNEVKRAILASEDLDRISDGWHRRDVAKTRLLSAPAILIGIGVQADVLNLMVVDVPNWVGALFVLIGIAYLAVPRVFNEKRTTESLVKHVIPADFRQS